MMFTAEIKDQFLATYRFCSNSFKWVYMAALKFAKHKIYQSDSPMIVRINFSNDAIVVVSEFYVSICSPTSAKIIDVERG